MTAQEVKFAYQEIAKKYGDDVSIDLAAGSLIKFGRNDDIDTAARETVWLTGGDEDYATGNDIDSVISTDAGDTQPIDVIGHVETDGNYIPIHQMQVRYLDLLSNLIFLDLIQM